jgi:hypothetical protein
MQIHVPAVVFLVILGIVQGPAVAGDCNRFAVTAGDGYTNVRSTPRIESDNLVAAFPTGTVVGGVDGADKEAPAWIQVSTPAWGWIHNSQLMSIGCDGSAAISPDSGLQAIQRLASKARAGDRRASASFLAMARGVDGSLADAYLDEISDWAAEQPATLATSIMKQPAVIREAALEMVDLSLEGASLETRGRFRIEMVRQ